MSRRIPTNPGSDSLVSGQSYAQQQQQQPPSRVPGEQSRAGKNHHSAGHQTQYPHGQVQPTQHQPKSCQTTINIQLPRRQPTTPHARPPTQAVATQPSQHPQPDLLPPYPNPGPPDAFITEKGRKIPIWYNPPGIVDKVMSPRVQAEYDKIRRQIIDANRREGST